MSRFLGSVLIYGQIECLSGLHIGGTGTGYEIGGMDNPVIRNPVDDFPYIPGSSLKGKMRSMLEWSDPTLLNDGDIHSCNQPDCIVCRIFGSSAAEERRAGPTRLLVRDAHPDAPTRAMMEELERRQGLPKVEIKTEDNINRITSATLSGPRSQERVPVGSRFNFELHYQMYEVEGCTVSDLEMLDHLFLALRLVESSALGGGSSRGSGQVKFWLARDLPIRNLDAYRQGIYPEKLFFKEETDRKKLCSLEDFSLTELKKAIQEKCT